MWRLCPPPPSLPLPSQRIDPVWSCHNSDSFFQKNSNSWQEFQCILEVSRQSTFYSGIKWRPKKKLNSNSCFFFFGGKGKRGGGGWGGVVVWKIADYLAVGSQDWRLTILRAATREQSGEIMTSVRGRPEPTMTSWTGVARSTNWATAPPYNKENQFAKMYLENLYLGFLTNNS